MQPPSITRNLASLSSAQSDVQAAVELFRANRELPLQGPVPRHNAEQLGDLDECMAMNEAYEPHGFPVEMDRSAMQYERDCLVGDSF